mgnify:CR=1 FL=1
MARVIAVFAAGRHSTMAHLWLFDVADDWAILPLDEGDTYDLDVWPPAPVAGDDAAEPGPEGTTRFPPTRAALMHAQTPEGARWVVLAGAPRAALVNGLPVLAGVRTLGDRDELRIEGRPSMFFSTERIAELSTFPGHAQRLSCPRCREPIDAGTPAVRCPHCDVWHHERPDRSCWTYSAQCATCGHPTALDAGLTWTPEGH